MIHLGCGKVGSDWSWHAYLKTFLFCTVFHKVCIHYIYLREKLILFNLLWDVRTHVMILNLKRKLVETLQTNILYSTLNVYICKIVTFTFCKRDTSVCSYCSNIQLLLWTVSWEDIRFCVHKSISIRWTANKTMF